MPFLKSSNEINLWLRVATCFPETKFVYCKDQKLLLKRTGYESTCIRFRETKYRLLALQNAAEVYLEKKWKYLTELNIHLLFWMLDELNIETKVLMASELEVAGKRDELVLNICRLIGTDVYLSGLGARDYLDEDNFRENGVKVIWQDFKHPHYPQLWGDFEPGMSAIDLLMNCGEDGHGIIMSV